MAPVQPSQTTRSAMRMQIMDRVLIGIFEIGSQRPTDRGYQEAEDTIYHRYSRLLRSYYQQPQYTQGQWYIQSDTSPFKILDPYLSSLECLPDCSAWKKPNGLVGHVHHQRR